MKNTDVAKIEKVLTLVHAKYNAAMNADSLVALVNLSALAFRRAFYGVSASAPIRYSKKIRRNKARHLGHVLTVTCGLAVLVFVLCVGQAMAGSVPEAVQGRLDLRSWDFDRNGSVALKGEWEFFNEQLLRPSELVARPFPEPTGYFHIPGFWNGYAVDGKTLTGAGFATFRLRVRLEQGPHALALRLEDQATAYRLWVNGALVMGNGVVAKTRQEGFPQYLVQIATIPGQTETLDLVLQVSNFDLHRGGPYRSISLGIESRVRRSQMLLWGVDFLTFAVLMVVGIYHVVFYLLRRKEPAVTSFGILCLLWGAHIPFWGAGGKLITFLFPDFSWQVMYKLDLLTWYSAVPFLLMFVSSLYAGELPVGLVRLYQWIAGAFVLVVVCTPPRIAGLTVLGYETYALLNIPPISWILYQAFRKRRKGIGLTLFGFILFVITAMNDILYNMDLIYTCNLIPVGLLGFVLSQSFELARRYAAAFSASESFSRMLEKANAVLAASNEDLIRSNRALGDNLRLKIALEDQKKEKQRAQLHAEKNALEKLRYQLNPHFLFNALTSIRGAVRKHPNLAAEMIEKLAEFYRRTLLYGKSDRVSVADAVALIRLYLDMERVRLGKYLTVDVNLDPALAHLETSSMFLQPLVENAVKYGRLTSPDQLEIKVNVNSPETGRLRLEVINSGRWAEPEITADTRSTGIGLENLRKRLETFYPGEHDFRVDTTGGRVAIAIDIPIIKRQA